MSLPNDGGIDKIIVPAKEWRGVLIGSVDRSWMFRERTFKSLAIGDRFITSDLGELEKIDESRARAVDGWIYKMPDISRLVVPSTKRTLDEIDPAK